MLDPQQFGQLTVSERRTVLITGGTGSLGGHTARAITEASATWTIVITGRNREALARTATDIGDGAGDRVLGLPLDLASLGDVRRFSADLAGRGLPPLHAIVCNAAAQWVSGTPVSVEGFEATFAVNHLAHFLLVQELLPQLAEPGRIVLVASDTHDPARHTGMPPPVYTTARALASPDDTGPESAARRGRRRYTTSKLCNVLMAYELARRLGEPDEGGPPRITVNAFDPGLMPGTGLARDYRRVQALAWRYLLPALIIVPGLNAHSPAHSARALARLVLDPDLAATTGRYFSGRREVRSSRESYDRDKAADLWQTSLELTTGG